MVNCHIVSNSAGNAADGCMLGLPAASIYVGGNTPFGISGLDDGSSRVLGSEFVGNGSGMIGGGHVVNSTVTQNNALRTGGGLFVITNRNLGGSWQYDTDAFI